MKKKKPLVLLIALLITGLAAALLINILKSPSNELLSLREIEGKILPDNPISRSEIDKGCRKYEPQPKEISDGVKCVQRIRTIYSGEEVFHSVRSRLIDEGWKLSPEDVDREHFTKEVNGLSACVYLTRAHASIDSEEINSEITVATLKDDLCWPWFHDEPRSLN